MKKILIIFLLCLIFFGGGWLFHFLYPQGGPPWKTKVIQRWELNKVLNIEKGRFSEVTLVDEKDMGGYTRRLLRLRWRGLSLEAFLLIPHMNDDKVPAILALPGHHSTKEHVIGERPSRFGVDYGQKLVKSGFCILAPDIPFSEDIRVEDHVALNLIMTGSNIKGLRISYLMALIDYLSSLPFIDPERLGCAGWSMGGALTMYLAAVDKRVKAAAISNYFGTYKDTCMKIRQTTDNYIPGILQFGEMADVACLIALRPLWIEGSSNDPEFPKEAFMSGVEALKKCYGGHEERLTWQLIPGSHRFEGQGLEEWFKRWL